MPDFGGQVAPSPPLASRPATRVQFGLGAVLQYSTTPSLRAAGSEDSLPRRRLGEGGRTTTRTACPTWLFCARWLAVLSASEVGRTKRLVSYVGQGRKAAKVRRVRCELSAESQNPEA